MRKSQRILPATSFRSSLQIVAVCLLVLILGQFAAGQSERAPVPEAAKQREILELVNETYGLKKLETATKKQQAMKKLLAAADDTSLTADERYVVLTTLLRLSQEIADFASWREAIGRLGAGYQIDAAEETAQRLKAYLEAAKTSVALRGKAMDEVAALILQVARANRYDDVEALLDAADAAAQRIKASSAIKQTLTKTRASVAERTKAWKNFEAASKKLETNADDPEANLTAGRWQAIHENDWMKAVGFLIKSNSAGWKKAGELEQKSEHDPAQKVAAGDAWWDLAEDESGSVKTSLMLHAGELYEAGSEHLTSGIQKQLVTKRLAEIAPLKPMETDAPQVAKAAATSPKSTGDTPVAPPGEWVDILQWAEGLDWAPRGINWNGNLEEPVSKEGVVLKPLRANRFPLPAIIDGDYEMEVEFTRLAGSNSVAVFFPVGLHNMHLDCATDQGMSAVHWINGTAGWLGDRPTVREHAPFENNVRHKLLFRVARAGDEAEFHIDLNNEKDWIKWKGPYSSLENLDSGEWRLTMTRHPWIGAWLSRVQFHTFRVRMLSGTLSRDVINDADREQDLKDGYVRLIGQPAISPTVGWAEFLVNQVPWQLGLGECERVSPLVSQEPVLCRDYYGAHAPSRVKVQIPAAAKSFSVAGYNIASRSTEFRILIDNQQVYRSGVVPLAMIKIDIPPKSSLLELVVDSVDSVAFDHSHWCYPRFHNVDKTKITDRMFDGPPGPLKFVALGSKVGVGSFSHNDQSAVLAPLDYTSVVPCSEFLFAAAKSSVSFEVPPGMTRFSAIGYNVRSRHVKFEVWSGARKLYESPQAGIVPMDVKLPRGTKQIDLKVDDLGDARDDFSMWCYPRLYKK